MGGSVSLHCNVTPEKEDSVFLILWFRDTNRNPIYSIDARTASIEKAEHTPDSTLLNRAYFNLSSDSFLHIENIKQEDGGEYKCRVDFRRGRTVQKIIKLIVIGKYSLDILQNLSKISSQ